MAGNKKPEKPKSDKEKQKEELDEKVKEIKDKYPDGGPDFDKAVKELNKEINKGYIFDDPVNTGKIQSGNIVAIISGDILAKGATGSGASVAVVYRKGVSG